jgi:hypothetical protein
VHLDLRGELSFEAHQLTRNGDRGSRPITGRVRANGSRISVTFSRSPSLRGPSRSSSRRWVDLLDRSGLTVQVEGPYGPVVTAGHGVRSSWWQALTTGSHGIRLGSRRAVLGTLRGPRLFDIAVPEWVRPTAVPRDRRLTSTLKNVLARRESKE